MAMTGSLIREIPAGITGAVVTGEVAGANGVAASVDLTVAAGASAGRNVAVETSAAAATAAVEENGILKRIRPLPITATDADKAGFVKIRLTVNTLRPYLLIFSRMLTFTNA